MSRGSYTRVPEFKHFTPSTRYELQVPLALSGPPSPPLPTKRVLMFLQLTFVGECLVVSSNRTYVVTPSYWIPDCSPTVDESLYVLFSLAGCRRGFMSPSSIPIFYTLSDVHYVTRSKLFICERSRESYSEPTSSAVIVVPKSSAWSS